MRILVTGGAGYIGSHTVLELLQRGHDVAVFDSLELGHKESLDRIERKVAKKIPFYQGSLLDQEIFRKSVDDFKPVGVIHFAAYSLVGESMNAPLKYYHNNLVGGMNILKTLTECHVNYVVFSSTAAVFGQPDTVPISEDTVESPINPYGSSKLMFERIMRDVSQSSDLRFVALRYFNACGCEPDGLIGEDHTQETHLIPIIMDAALGKRPSVSIFGTDYDTPDGTCIRDYIHVLDLADAHIKALEYLSREKTSNIFNLGSATGFSVRQIIDEVKKVSGTDFQIQEAERRPGDPAVLIADSTKANTILGWKPTRSLDEIIKSAWAWETCKATYDY